MVQHTTAAKLAQSPSLSLAQAKEYDYILMMDQSGSMSEPSTKLEGKTRWDEAAEFTTAFARWADTVDADGITVITYNSGAKMHDNVTADKVKEIFTKQRPAGGTNLAGALELAFSHHFKTSKPTIIVCVTDGAPDSETAVSKAIIAASKKLERDEQLAVQFVQIGDDEKAAKFLEQLDDNLTTQGAKFDIVNALTREEAEQLTPEQLCYQAIND